MTRRCRIGVGRTRLTPTEPGANVGWSFSGRKDTRPPDEADQQLYATALTLEDGDGQRVVFVNVDLHGGGADLWRAAVAASGLDASRVVICGTHTHAGPGQRYNLLYRLFAPATPVGAIKSGRRLEALIAEAVTASRDALTDGGVDVVRGAASGTGSNRALPSWSHYDDEFRAEFVSTGPGAAADEAHVADRYRDPRVTALVAQSDDGTQRCVLAWHAVHGTSLGPKWPTFGAGLFGVARARAEAELGGTLVGFGGGASADISPLPMDERGERRADGAGRPTEQGRALAEAVGTQLATALTAIVRAATPAPFTLATAHEQWRPTRTGLPGPLFGMATIGGGFDGPTDMRPRVGDGIHAPLYRKRQRWRRPMSHGQGPKISIACAVSPVPLPIGWLIRAIAPRSLPLHAIRVNDHTFATVPGEPTTITGWRIERSVAKAAQTSSASVIGFAGEYAGYWVTPEEYLEQRYEGSSTLWGREAATVLEQRLTGLASTLRAPGDGDAG